MSISKSSIWKGIAGLSVFFFMLVAQPIIGIATNKVALANSEPEFSATTIATPKYNVSDGKVFEGGPSTEVKLVWGGLANGSRYEVRWAASLEELTGVEPVNTGQYPYKTVSSIDNGTWFWQMRAQKDGAYSEWATPRSFTVKIDREVPVVAAPIIISAMSGGRDVKSSSTNNSDITLNWQAVEDATGYEYGYWNDIAGNSHKESRPYIVTKGADELSYSGSFNQGEGKHYLAVRSLGASGVKSDWSVTSVIYDKTQPIINIMSPLPNSVVGNGMVDVEVHITETGSGVEYVNAHFSNGPSADSPKARLALKPGATDVYIGQVDTTGMNGVYRLSVSTRDMALNTRSSVAQKITIDNTAPEISIKDFQGNLNQKIFREVSFGYYDANKAAYAQFNGGKIHDFTDAVWSNTDNVWANRGWTGVVEGLNTVDLYDVVGNKNTLKFTIDRTAPVATISSPTGDLVKGDVVITGLVDDANPMNSHFRIEDSSGKPVKSETKTDGRSEHTLSWDTRKVADGEYVIFFETRDQAGNKDGTTAKSGASVAVKKVFVDNGLPVVAGFEFKDSKGGDIAGDVFNPHKIVAKAVDAEGGSGVTDLYLNAYRQNTDGSWKMMYGTYSQGNPSGRSFIEILVSDARFQYDGTYKVEVWTKDKIGNESVKLESPVFVVDKTFPTAEIVAPAANSINPTEFIIRAGDSHGLGAITAILRTSSGKEVVTSCSKVTKLSGETDFTLTCQIPADLADGKYNIRYNSRDLAGNQVASKQLDFTVDRTAPELAIGTISSGQVSGTVNDTEARVYVMINGEEREAIVDEAGIWDFSFSPVLGPGNHIIELYAVDQPGNRSASIYRSVNVPATEVVIQALNNTDTSGSGGVAGVSDSSSRGVASLSPAASYWLDSQAGGVSASADVEPASSTAQTRGVLAEQDTREAVLDTGLESSKHEKGCFTIFGICWYWWIPVVVIVVAILAWIVIRAKHRNEEQ